ncbi:BTB/POZ domain-containing protein KCTD9-like [Amphiura filiformis]|uniref:BTB/POZ domain-containing protein KCTD9-like n=1 Tax=Amphiura filiformis TaxID=82378 RepID=UPI003B222E65
MRVTIFRNGRVGDGHVILCPESLEVLLTVTGEVLDINAKVIYAASGGKISDIRLIREDDVLFISEGEPYLDSKTVIATNCQTSTNTNICVSHGREQLQKSSHNDWVTLNVGGVHFTTTRITLAGRESDTMLARMFADEGIPWHSAVDHTGAYLIDRSPRYFEPILNYLRHGELILDDGVSPSGVLEEAKFFGITSIIKQLEEMVKSKEPPSDHSAITRREFVKLLKGVAVNGELRCQGMNFAGADLSKLDLRFINFKMANLSGANLTLANLSYCSLERANLSGANMDGANLQGVKMVLANLEGASLRNCNFEDPCGSKANLEGVNMKGVNLEDSQMTGVNLRVATLKNANLKNSNLRWAVLAGTDLENCNLTGSDLQDANLRGANVKNATFEEMLTPLHMSQSVR